MICAQHMGSRSLWAVVRETYRDAGLKPPRNPRSIGSGAEMLMMISFFIFRVALRHFDPESTLDGTTFCHGKKGWLWEVAWQWKKVVPNWTLQVFFGVSYGWYGRDIQTYLFYPKFSRHLLTIYFHSDLNLFFFHVKHPRLGSLPILLRYASTPTWLFSSTARRKGEGYSASLGRLFANP